MIQQNFGLLFWQIISFIGFATLSFLLIRFLVRGGNKKSANLLALCALSLFAYSCEEAPSPIQNQPVKTSEASTSEEIISRPASLEDTNRPILVFNDQERMNQFVTELQYSLQNDSDGHVLAELAGINIPAALSEAINSGVALVQRTTYSSAPSTPSSILSMCVVESCTD